MSAKEAKTAPAAIFRRRAYSLECVEEDRFSEGQVVR